MVSTHKQALLTSRRVLRHAVAALIWLHALFATNFLHIPPLRTGISTGLATDLGLLSFIFFYGIICDSGWASAWFDALYIYLWPCVLVFKVLYSAVRYLWKRFKPSSPQAAPVAPNQPNAEPAKNEVSKPPNVAIRVFGQFGLLWGAIILNTNVKAIAIVATAAALFGALRASYNLWDFISDSIDWIESLESPASRQMANAIKAVRESDVLDQSQQVKNAANVLKFAEMVCNFLANKKQTLSKITRTVALCITVPFYIYISSILQSSI